MATSASRTLVQTIYLAYYGRPADPDGLDFWCDQLDAAGGDLFAIIDAFGTSQEFVDNFGSFDDEALVDNLFLQMFGRHAEPEGLTFYLGDLQSGTRTLISIALDIANGAQNEDLSTLDNRRSFADEFTAQIRERDAPYGQAQLETVKELLGSVTDDDSSVDAATLFADRFIESSLGNPSTSDDLAGDVTTAGLLQIDNPGAGVIESLQDRDWFAVELTEDVRYTIALSGISSDPIAESTPTLTLVIYDAGGNPTTVFAAGIGPDPQADLEFSPEVTGTFFVSAEAMDYWLGNYSVSVVQLPPEDDFASDNSTDGVVSVDTAATGEIEIGGDADWFEIELITGNSYSIGLTGTGTDEVSTGTGTLALGIYDAQGNLLSTSGVGTGQNPSIDFVYSSSASGMFFLAAEGRSDWRGNYQLSVERLEPDDDFADDIGTTGGVSVGGQVSGAIEFADDRDWFSVSLTAGQRYQFELIGAEGGGGTLPDPWLLLHDSNGSFLTGNNNAGGSLDSLLSFTAPARGNYFLSAESNVSTDLGSYTLTASLVPVQPPGPSSEFGPGFGDVYVISDLSNFLGFELIDVVGDIDTVALLDNAFETTAKLTITEDIDLQAIEAAVVVPGTPAFDFDFLDLSHVTSAVTVSGLTATTTATDDGLIVGRFADYDNNAPVTIRGFGSVWLSATTEGSEFIVNRDVNEIQDGSGAELANFNAVKQFNASLVQDRDLTITVIDQVGVDTTVVGGSGNDTITSNRGNDLLVGGPGADTLSGGRNSEVHIFDLTGTTLEPTADLTITLGDTATVSIVEGTNFAAGADLDQLGSAIASANWSAATFDHDGLGGTPELGFFQLVESVDYDALNNRIIFTLRPEIRDADDTALNFSVTVPDAAATVTIEEFDASTMGPRNPFLSLPNSIDAVDSADTYRYLAGTDSTRTAMDTIIDFDITDDIDVADLLEDLVGDTDTPLDKGMVNFAALTDAGFFGADGLAFGNDGTDSRLWADLNNNGNLDSTDFELTISNYLLVATDFSVTLTGSAAGEMLSSGKTADLITALGGDDTIVLRGGNDVVELGPADAVTDVIDFMLGSDLKFINDFETTIDDLSFVGVVIGSGTGSAITAAAGTAVTAGALAAVALGGDTIYVINDGATALTGAGSESITDYRNRTDVAAYLAEGFTSTAATNTAVFVINDLVSAKSFVYLFDEDAGRTSLSIDAEDLTLIGVITEESGLALTAGDIA